MTKTYVDDAPSSGAGWTNWVRRRSPAGAERAPVDVDDEVVSMLRFGSRAIGSLEATRNAWGRNNFITEICTDEEGSIHFNYERRDELQVMFADDPADARGFRTVYTGPAHPRRRSVADHPVWASAIRNEDRRMLRPVRKRDCQWQAAQPEFRGWSADELVADALLRSSR